MTTDRLSALLHRACQAGFLLVFPVIAAAIWVSLTDPVALAEGMPEVTPLAPVPLLARIALAGVVTLALSVVAYILLQTARFFAICRSRDMLTPAAALQIHRIGIGALTLALISLLAHPVLGLLLTWANPEGQRVLALAVSGSDLSLLLLSGLLVMIGRALQEAAAIAAENRAFV